MPLPSRPAQRGSVLIVAMLLLLVLTILGVAAVSASTKERLASGVKSRHDRLLACARAAQAKIWAEVAMQGPGYLTGASPVTAITLPDGTQLTAPAHYDTQADGSVEARTVTLVVRDGASGARLPASANMSNQGEIAAPPGNVTRVTARCVDTFGRPFEVELAVRFAF
jgi:type IV pilus assembly PilX-like protein